MIKPLHVAPSINSLPFFAKICDNLLHSLNLDPNTIVVKWLEECPSEIWEGIFTWLRDADTKTLLACRETCSDFAYWVDKKTTLWSRMSLHKAVEDNNVDICQRIIEVVEDKNPADKNTATEICWQTPLHVAAAFGRLKIYRLIMEYVQDKNPANNWGMTPLHMAAEYGHLEMCRFILENVRDAYPVNQEGVESLLDLARSGGHAAVCQLFEEHLTLNQKFLGSITPHQHFF